MAAKEIQISRDDTTYYLLPGNSGDFSVETNALDDTVFGREYTSQFPGLLSWSVTSNAMIRGIAGYCAKVQKTGTATSFTGESASQVGTSQVYEIDDRSKSVFDWTSAVTVNDGGTPVAAADIEEIIHVQGQVEFVAGYTPSGAITIDGDYLPLTAFGTANSFSLTQNADTTDDTDFETACTNGGWITQRATLLTADAELSGFYNATDELFDLLTSRDTFVLEFDPVGGGEATARGIYVGSTDNQTGDVGGDEEETFAVFLNVPEETKPFAWRNTAASDVPTAVQELLDAWAARESVYVKYLPEGEGNEGRKGQLIVTDISLEVSVDGMAEYSFTGDGTGKAERINN